MVNNLCLMTKRIFKFSLPFFFTFYFLFFLCIRTEICALCQCATNYMKFDENLNIMHFSYKIDCQVGVGPD